MSSKPIKVVERPKKRATTVRLRDLDVRPSMDDAEIAYYLRVLESSLEDISEDLGYLTSRAWRSSRRERLRASGKLSWLWLYRLGGRSKYAVLRDLVATARHRELFGHVQLNGRGEGLGRDEDSRELEDV